MRKLNTPRDLAGQRFGKLTAISLVLHPRKGRGKGSRRFWVCRCDCETEKEISQDGLLCARPQKSCGCLRRLKGYPSPSYRHGRPMELYKIWQGIKYRCHTNTPKNVKYADYGGRGIIVCDEWRYDFQKFAEYVGKRSSPMHSLDRIDNNGNYEPGNVRWATNREQANNRRIAIGNNEADALRREIIRLNELLAAKFSHTTLSGYQN